MARDMLTRTRRHEDAVLIINDQVDIALEIGADGVHVGQQDEDCERVIRRVPAEMIVGIGPSSRTGVGCTKKGGHLCRRRFCCGDIDQTGCRGGWL